MDLDDSPHRRLIKRYQALVDKMFLDGLNTEENMEMKRLGDEIDADNAPFYESVMQRLKR